VRAYVPGFAVLALTALIAVGWLSVSHDDDRNDSRAAAPGVQRFLSRPDLRPAAVTVKTRPTGTEPGLVFLAPKGGKSQNGPMITDDNGRVVWFAPTKPHVIADDFRVQRYRGRPVLTWWEGRTNPKGWGAGTYVIADRAYHEIARIRAGHGLQGDLHEFRLTDRGTALITIYERVPADVSAVGGPKDGEIVDSIVQEVDVATGEVRFQWHSSDHVPITESHARPPSVKHPFAYDYFHVNSVALDRDGNYLVSARNTWTIYKLNRRTGRIIWRLGGKHSDFQLGDGVRFAWQHDAERQPDGTLTLFDNESVPKIGDRSRAIRLDLDEHRHTATLVKALTHPDRVLADAEGNHQVLPGGGSFVGWGLPGRVSEFGPDGRLLLDLQLPPKVDSYRAYRFLWQGRPDRPPAVAARRTDGGLDALASWNGATGVAGWQLLTGDEPTDLEPGDTTDRTGFETALPVPGDPAYLAVRAVDANGRTLATSAAVRPPDR
jgi:hypothetical protein